MKEDGNHHPFVIVQRLEGERIHRCLKDSQMLHNDIAPVDFEHGTVAFPLASLERFEQQRERVDSLSSIPLEVVLLPPYYMKPTKPQERLNSMVTEWWSGLQRDGTSKHLEPFLEHLPKKWERLGELILFPNGSFSEDIWVNLSDESKSNLWITIASALKVKSIGIQSPIADDAVRSSQATVLHGSSQVSFLDHGIHYQFDAAKVMFSSGNITERRRIGAMNMNGETIVDAYAGIGYYSFPMIVNAGATHVHACEMNPASIEGLLLGAQKNQIENKITVHRGDNQTTLPLLKGKADRCHLGLLPSSEATWGLCLEALKPEGGWLHVHMNVEEEKIDRWKETTVDRMQTMSDECNLGFSIQGVHLERVKWYAPFVRHVVFDIECRPKDLRPSC